MTTAGYGPQAVPLNGHSFHTTPRGLARTSARRSLSDPSSVTPLVDVVHHGSTAVPGLVAKPIIDIAVLIKAKDTANSFVPALDKLGYRLDQESSERLFLVKDAQPRVHLSVAYADFADFFERQVVFRDWLRTNSRARNEYAALKTELAATSGGDLAAPARAPRRPVRVTRGRVDRPLRGS